MLGQPLPWQHSAVQHVARPAQQSVLPAFSKQFFFGSLVPIRIGCNLLADAEVLPRHCSARHSKQGQATAGQT